MRKACWYILFVLIAIMSAAATSSPVIMNSGSTNTPGFRITVQSDGAAEYTTVPRGQLQQASEPMKRNLPSDLVHRFFADLDAAHPFSNLPRPHCMKSASFGTRLTIQLDNDETPDLTCGDGNNAKLRALIQDANQIVALFNTR